MNLVSTLTTWMLEQRFRQIDYFRRHPHQAQARIFQQLIAQGSLTQFGAQHNFSRIKSPADFARQVPISTYEQLFPWIERVLKGEKDVLWPGRIDWFSKSSGTTNDRSKYIPVSQASLYDCHYKGGKDLIAIYLHERPGTRVLQGKTLALGGSLIENPWRPGTQIGDVSAVIMKNLPWWAQRMRAPQIEIALMDKWEYKIEAMIATCAKENITSLSGVPTWMVVLLQRMVEMHKAQSILDIWPNLEVFLHGAVSFGPYRELFRQLIPSDTMQYLETYNASEGFFGIQDRLDQPDQMLLMLDYGIWYEFIPMDEWGSEQPRTIPLSEVEKDKNYAMVISTNGGLWRYLIGDTVRFTSVEPYRIKVSGRTKHFINAFGEELIVENAERALSEACERTGGIVREFTAAPVFMDNSGKGSHEWVVEFTKAPESLDHFTDVLDTSLRRLNSDYDAKRYQNLALLKPILRLVPQGTFHKWMARRGKLGGQHKVPRLANDRRYVEEILEMV